MVDNGWITLHRKMLKWEWYDDANVVRLFIHCLLKSNHAHTKWRGISIESGQFITSQQHLADELNLSVKQIRSALNKLKMTGEVAVKTNNKYSMISIANWSEHQDKGRQAGNPKAGKGQAKGRQRATNNNDNNDNNKPKGDSELPAWLNKEAWSEFEQHRKDIKKPLTPMAAKKNISILEKHKTQQQEIIDKTIANQWTGLFALKGNFQDNKTITDDPENDYNHYRKVGQELGINPTSTESNKEYIARVKNA